MHQPRFQPVLAFLALVVCVLGFAAPARAQDADTSRARITAWKFGFSGTPIYERWGPAYITVAPGDAPFQGAVSITVQQDSTQSARFVAPVAVAPGQSPARLCVPFVMGMNAREITLTLSGVERAADTPSRSREQSFRLDTSFRASRDDNAFPYPAPPESPLVISAGALSEVPTSAINFTWPQTNAPRGPGSTLSSASIALDDLPSSWVAYQGLSVLVVRGQDALKIEPRQLAAVRQWVLSGGRLLILADQPGPEFRAWLPPGVGVDGGEFVQHEPVATNGVWPSDLRAHARGQTFDTAPRRWLRLTPAAQREGWTLDYRDAERGLIASGPVGFGLVIIAGFDPSRAVVSGADTSALWSNLLRAADVSASPTAVYMRGSGESDAAAGALRSVLDASLGTLDVSSSVGLGIGAVLLALALLIGPGDRWLLGRLRQRHRSWLSALLWIALASGVLLFLPSLVRGGRSVAVRYEVIDQRVPAPESSVPPLAFSNELRSAFSSAPLDADWPGLHAGAAVRGVAGSGARGGGVISQPAPLDVLVTPSTTGDTPDPWGGFALGDASGSVLPVNTTQLRSFSLRSIFSTTRVQPPLAAIAIDDGAGRVIRVSGLPAGSAPIRARLRTSDGPSAPDFSVLPTGEIEIRWQQPATTNPGGPWSAPPGSRESIEATLSAAQLVEGLFLPGLGARASAADRLIAAGHYAQVLLLVRSDAPAPAAGGIDHTEHHTLYRLLVPVPWGASAPAPAALP